MARSTFRSQNVQSTPFLDHFWKLRCRKSARRCGAKHISKSKCTRHTILGPLLEVAMSKKCTPLWREGHFEVNMVKTSGVRTAFGRSDVEKAHAVAARGTFRRQNGKNTMGSDPTFERSDVAKVHAVVVRRCAKHIRSQHVKSTPQGFGPLLDVQMSSRMAGAKDGAPKSEQNVRARACGIFNYNRHYTTLHSNTLQLQLHLHYIPLHYTTLHSTTLHYTTLHSTTLHYITLHSTTRHYNYTTLHSTTLHSTTLHYTTLNYATLHYMTLPNIILQLQLQLYNHNYNYNYNYQ